MQHDRIELREGDDRAVEPDGYHHATPECEPAEYRRVGTVDSEQQAPVHDRLGELIAGWDR